MDELFVAAESRGRGLATRRLVQPTKNSGLWLVRPAALALEVTPEIERARAL